MLSDILPEIAILISLASLLISLASLILAWRRTRKEQPLLQHEVFDCNHTVTQDGKSTNLGISFRLHNRGERGTKLNRIEAFATDFNGLEHQSSLDLSKVEYLDAHDSTEKIRVLFYFSPHFQYQEKMSCRFMIYHTTGRYPFECESEESEGYLGIQVLTGKRGY